MECCFKKTVDILIKKAITPKTILCDSGVVVGRKEGKWMHYSITKDGLGNVINYLNELMKNAKITEESYQSCQ